jgi:hypothetical protein
MIVKTTKNSRGVRIGNFVQVRDAIRRVRGGFASEKTAKEAVGGAKKGNELIEVQGAKGLGRNRPGKGAGRCGPAPFRPIGCFATHRTPLPPSWKASRFESRWLPYAGRAADRDHGRFLLLARVPACAVAVARAAFG